MPNNEHNEFFRKFLHLLTLLIPLVAYYYSVLPVQIILGLAVVFYGYAERQKLKGRKLFFHRWISSAQRPEEQKTFAKAPLLLALGVFGAITFFSWEASAIGIYQVGFCDTIAALCGKKWGKTLLPFSERKTYVGVAAYFLCALPVAFYFLSPSHAVVLALLGAFLESLPSKDWDNFTIPLVISMIAESFLL